MNDLLFRAAGLVDVECDLAKHRYGTTYASHHEAFGVLAEEVQEAYDELNTVEADMDHLLRYTRTGDAEGIRLGLEAIKANAIRAAAESVQVAAVCSKWLDMMGGAENVSHP